MKNLINYYYNLIISDFRKIDDYYNFDVNNIKYCFLPFEGDITYLQKIYSTLYRSNKYCHEIVINKDNSILTIYENKPYILLKKMFNINRKITFEEIVNYDTLVYDEAVLNWKELWEQKIDYYEYQMNQFGFKYKILKNSFNYYIGLSETAISLLNYVDNKLIDFYISHKRITNDDNCDYFFNPMNIIIDSRVRDIAEYIKVNYLNQLIDFNQVINILNSIKLNYSENILLLSRLLYPSQYFDIYDRIIQEKISEEKAIFYIKKNLYYEDFLKKIYKYLKNKQRMPEIQWLEY